MAENQINAFEDVDPFYPLHYLVFHNESQRLKDFISHHCVSSRKSPGYDLLLRQDRYGNTALHLAVMLGHFDCIDVLLDANLPVKIKNNAGWNCIAEAVSYGNKSVLIKLIKKLKQQAKETLEQKRPSVVAALLKMQDFAMTFKWEMQSWIPLVSRLLPSDICHLRKSGYKLRLDTTLTEFSDNKWERGDLTFLFNGEKKIRHSLHILDNEKKVYQRCQYEESEKDIEMEADMLLSSDNVVAHLNADRVQFIRDRKGWLWREERSEYVGHYHADFYHITNMVVESKKRREHLTEDDVKKNKEILESFRKGALSNNINVERRQSLNPPPRPTVTWHQYLHNITPSHSANKVSSSRSIIINSQIPPCLGRPAKVKDHKKSFKATIAMSQEFPMKVSDLLDILELIAPFKHFTRLREFLMNKLPPGFPVRVDIPVFPSITARVTFQTLAFFDSLPEHLFQIPASYKFDPSSFRHT